MDERKPLYEVVGGSGTYADPMRMKSGLLNLINRITSTGRRVPRQIAEARERLAEVDVTEEIRCQLGEQITVKEYLWHLNRAAHLVQQAMGEHRPASMAAAKREELLSEARQARETFFEFATMHPAIHESQQGKVPPVEELLARYEARRRD